IKQDYAKSGVYITPTMKEIDALAEEGVDIIALDATQLTRPDGSTFADFFQKVREKYPKQLFMGDCSTVEEGMEEEKAGEDVVAAGSRDAREQAARALSVGSHAVVVGSEITRPQLITKKFRDAIDN